MGNETSAQLRQPVPTEPCNPGACTSNVERELHRRCESARIGRPHASRDRRRQREPPIWGRRSVIRTSTLAPATNTRRSPHRCRQQPPQHCPPMRFAGMSAAKTGGRRPVLNARQPPRRPESSSQVQAPEPDHWRPAGQARARASSPAAMQRSMRKDALARQSRIRGCRWRLADPEGSLRSARETPRHTPRARPSETVEEVASHTVLSRRHPQSTQASHRQLLHSGQLGCQRHRTGSCQSVWTAAVVT